MAIVTSREELKEYCLRKLGHPLITIDITDEQMEDRIDEAIAFFHEYYFDGIEKTFFKHQLTQDDIDNRFVQMPDHIWAVTRIFPISNTSSVQPNIFDLQWQLRMNDIRDLTSTSLVYYNQVMDHVALIDWLLNVKRTFRFNRLNNKLYIDTNWNRKMGVGEWLVVEAYAALNPTDSPKFWNERIFKEYVTALFKQQWAAPLKKYNGVTLPGGVQLDGQALFDEATQELKELEDQIINNGGPLEFIMG